MELGFPRRDFRLRLGFRDGENFVDSIFRRLLVFRFRHGCGDCFLFLQGRVMMARAERGNRKDERKNQGSDYEIRIRHQSRSLAKKEPAPVAVQIEP